MQTPVDDYVLEQARPMRRTLAEYAGLLTDPDCLCLRYEDMVFQKRRMVRKVLEHFGWTLPAPQLDVLMTQIDKVPEVEEPTRFLRKAIPGDHRVKLRADTIAALDDLLRPMLRRYDY